MSLTQYHPTKLRGFYLFEILITLVVMSIGMLGIAAMLMVAHKVASSSYLRTQALQLAYSMIESMRSNRDAAINGNYNASNLTSSGSPSLPSTPSPNCMQSICTTQQLARFETWFFLNQLNSSLPQGSGSISTTTSAGNTIATIIIQWNDSPAQNLIGASGEVANSNSSFARFTLVTSL